MIVLFVVLLFVIIFGSSYTVLDMTESLLAAMAAASVAGGLMAYFGTILLFS